MHYLIEYKLDLSIFHPKYRNEDNGRLAYDPAILLKIILFAYSKGITSSREMQWCCETNIIFKALSCVTISHSTPLAKLVSSHSAEIEELFEQVLLVSHDQGLLGNQLFAIDGRFAITSKPIMSGTRQRPKPNWIVTSDERKPSCLWMKRNKEVKSNLTDNESAKMTISKGTIQSYNGVATVDRKHQIIIDARFKKLGIADSIYQQGMVITTDTGFANEANTKYHCPKKHQCMQNPNAANHRKGKGRQVSFTIEHKRLPNYTDWMKHRVDSPQGKEIYSHRMSVVAPVFGNIGTNKGLDHFSLRGKQKVQGQWQLYCLVHNIEKLANYGRMAA